MVSAAVAAATSSEVERASDTLETRSESGTLVSGGAGLRTLSRSSVLEVVGDTRSMGAFCGEGETKLMVSRAPEDISASRAGLLAVGTVVASAGGVVR
jgi:hypothetical protein